MFGMHPVHKVARDATGCELSEALPGQIASPTTVSQVPTRYDGLVSRSSVNKDLSTARPTCSYSKSGLDTLSRHAHAHAQLLDMLYTILKIDLLYLRENFTCMKK